MSRYHLYVVVTGVPEALVLRGAHLTFAYVPIFFLHPGGTRDHRRLPWRDVALIGLVLASIGCLFLNYEYVTTRIWADEPTPRQGFRHALRAADVVLFGVVAGTQKRRRA